ncbi:P-loop containing nucleoside triphosphate hydrolase protein [Thozetella sp. PMI_491]|nr:P-loop containing nucleoside triphosphate hydrolase protein [Thozetella sp. PMI_491]
MDSQHPQGQAPKAEVDQTTKKFFKHSDGKRVSTDTVILKALKAQYPNLEPVIVPDQTVQLLSFAAAGHATYTPIDDAGEGLPSSVTWNLYIPPARRLGGGNGAVLRDVSFGKFLYTFGEDEFILYVVNGRDGTNSYPMVINNYILAPDRHKVDALIFAAGKWASELHGEIWVYDRGFWQKSAELYNSIKNASWDAVILNPDMKKALINDHISFFNSRDTYAKLQVPWKRGVIYYGPPGNGKTISVKAMMHTLYSRDEAIPSLYVRSFFSYSGPEYAIAQIFGKAREFAPCYLIFEDLDSLVSDSVRSYFLNEVDGLRSNDGIFMVGSTNHLERLDPGISKRPSRFDRKYLFPNPIREERVAYSHFWQGKLADNKDIDFPDALCDAIADITDNFSFAYMQEAFVAALLAIARASDGSAFEGDWVQDTADDWVDVRPADGGDLKDNVLWSEIQKQIAILREGLESNPEVARRFKSLSLE